MALIFGDEKIIKDDKREVAHIEADELLEAALDKYKRLGLDSKTIGLNIMYGFNAWCEGVLDTLDFEAGVKLGFVDIWNIEEVADSNAD